MFSIFFSIFVVIFVNGFMGGKFFIDGLWFEVMVQVWGEVLDKQVSDIEVKFVGMSVGGDKLVDVIELIVMLLKMSFLASSLYIVVLLVGFVFEIMVCKQ